MCRSATAKYFLLHFFAPQCILYPLLCITARDMNMMDEQLRIILTICRIGLGTADAALRFQVERLEKAYRTQGKLEEAAALDKLLNQRQQETNLKPSRVIASFAASFPGEKLTPQVSVPVDKESGAPLADIHFPNPDSTGPVLDAELASSVDRLIEEWLHADELKAIGAPPARTCLLFGQPGTGKTRLAYHISNRLGLPLVLARLDGLISSFLGTTARNIGTLFQFANRYQCVLLLDEFDAIAKVRDDPQEVGEIKRVVNAILQNIDKRSLHGFTIAITNHENLLDPAVWRRFEIRIAMPPPSFKERAQILEIYLQPLPIDLPAINLLAWLSEGRTGSDLESMARSIKRYTAVHRQGDFSLIEALRAYILTNATAQANEKLALLMSSPQEIARRVLAEDCLGLTQQQVGRLLGRDQATISRWTKNETANPERPVAYAE